MGFISQKNDESNVIVLTERAPKDMCAVEECKRQPKENGFCTLHFRRWLEYGDPLRTRPTPIPESSSELKMLWVRTYKLGKGCTDCKWDEDEDALQFDHLPAFEKTATILNGRHLSWMALFTEISKCEVVCARCHTLRTVRRMREKHWWPYCDWFYELDRMYGEWLLSQGPIDAETDAKEKLNEG